MNSRREISSRLLKWHDVDFNQLEKGIKLEIDI